MANPNTLYWTGPDKMTDGSAFTSAEYAGFEIEVSQGGSATVIAVPAAWKADHAYSLPLRDLPLGVGPATVRMRTLSVGYGSSDWTNPVSFTLRGPPLPPQNVRVA